MPIQKREQMGKTKFGLIGKNIAYSFSRNYFQNKFRELKLERFTYKNYDLPEIDEFPFITYHKEEEFAGFNVTIPYKEAVIKYLDEIDEVAAEIGAVNTIKVTQDNLLIGYNTDVYGFENSIKPLLESHHKKALILGTGGASKAVAYVLNALNIDFKFVSRNTTKSNTITYKDLTNEMISAHQIIINTTPLGTYPNIEEKPKISYQLLNENHLLYDLIYNPEETAFLLEGKKHGAKIKNGSQMLELQAEKSWEIWLE